MRRDSRLAEFIAEVRTWIGTPFRHAGREKGIGVDCGGVWICALRDSGVFDYAKLNYGPFIDPSYVVTRILEPCHFVPPKERRPGDILLFNIHGIAQHTGVLVSETTFVHGYQSAGKVCETDLEPVFIRSLVAVFRIKEDLWPR